MREAQRTRPSTAPAYTAACVGSVATHVRATPRSAPCTASFTPSPIRQTRIVWSREHETMSDACPLSETESEVTERVCAVHVRKGRGAGEADSAARRS
eukprot:scaffold306886_cov30-Tisochrysis_lutea.AAC.3